MKHIFHLCSLFLIVVLTACTPAKTSFVPIAKLKEVTLDPAAKMVAGQTVYVSIYSHIYTWEQSRTMNLTATLSVRNTDANHPIILSSIRYYDSGGKLVRNYLAQSGELGPLASADFVVDEADTSGGSGASFLVDWVAQQPVSPPVIEAVMISATGSQGISFVTSGQVIHDRTQGNTTQPLQ